MTSAEGTRTPLQKLIRIVCALALGGVLALVAGELFFRLFPGFLPNQAQLRIHWKELLAGGTRSIAHPYCGFLYPPSTTGELAREGFRFTYTTDEKGFRNPGPWPERADVVVVGDSVTFSYGVEDDQAWTQLLRDARPELGIVNLALIGSCPEQYARLYETFGAELAPKLVVVGLFSANDCRDARLFDEWLAAGGEGNYDVWRFTGGRPPAGTLSLRGLRDHSYLLSFFEESLKARRSAFGARTIELAQGGRVRLTPSILEGSARGAKQGQPEFKLVMASLRRLKKLTEENGTELLVLLLPSKEEVYLPAFSLPTPEPLADFRTRLAQLGWNVLDLQPPLMERAQAGEQVYFEIDGHPNKRGYEVIAEALLAHLEEHAEALGLAAGDLSDAGGD
jgi:hypothetical protein